MSENDDNDILKRLRSVRKSLQDSLDDTGNVVEREKSNIELVGSQRAIEQEDRRRSFSEESKGPKLFKTASDDKPAVTNKEYKQKVGVSRKRMAAAQRRIKERVEAQRGISKKQKAVLLMAIVVVSLPLFMVNTVALATCRFDFDNVGLKYRGTPGWIKLTLPVYNPSFLDAELADISFELWAEHDVNGNAEYYSVGEIATSYQKTIAPFTTVVIDFNLILDPATAGDWLSDLFNSFKLKLLIHNFIYNDVKLINNIPLPEFDLSDMVADLTSGLNLDDLVGSAELDTNIGNVKNLWDMAESTPLLNYDPYTGLPKSSQSEEIPSFELLDVGIGEDDEKFQVKLDAAFGISEIDNFELGPIRISDLNITLYGPGGSGASSDTTSRDYYQNKIASLTTYDLEQDELADFTFGGVDRNKSYPLEINFGAVSYAAARLTLFKDNLDGSSVHPSANLNFSDTESVKAFEQANMTRYPMWYFIHNILSNQMLDCLIRIESLSIEIFGIPINDIKIDQSLLPILKSTRPLFDLDELTAGFMASPVGIFSTIGFFTQSIATLGSTIPGLSETQQDSLDMDALGDILGDINTDDLLDSIQESWGDDANISLGLGLELVNNILDIHLGIGGLRLSISNEIDTINGKETRAFALAEATNENGDPWIYLNGINSTTVINLGLTLMKNEEYAPHVAEFVRTLLEDFTLEGTALLEIGSLLLFAENYTFSGIAIPLGLDALGLDLEGEIGPMISDALEGLVPTEEDATNETTNSTSLKFSNPLTAPIELLSSILLGNPIMSPITGISIPNMQIVSEEKKKELFTPQAAQDIQISVEESGQQVDIDLIVPGLVLSEGTLPIHVGVGYTYLEVQSNSSNSYGEWAPLLGLTLNQYIEIGPEESELTIAAKLSIYKSDTLCAFFNALTDGRDTPSFSLKLAGTLTLNLSGVYIPNINLDLEVPDINLSFDLQELIDGLLGTSASISDDVDFEGPLAALVREDVPIWNGDYDNIPFVSQSINMDDVFEMGDFTLVKLEETGWPHVDQGSVKVEAIFGLTNHLMELELVDPILQITHDNGDPLINLNILNDDLKLKKDVPFNLHLELEIVKSEATEAWINNILWNFTISGRLNASLGLKIFGCQIGPLSLDMPLTDLLDTFGIEDISSLLYQILPLNDQNFRDSPHASQDMMDLIGDFGLGYISLQRDGDASPIQPVGELDYENPMLTAIAGLILQPAFNLSIKEADLYLCDKNIYDRIYSASGSDKDEAIKYSKMAQIELYPTSVYANNTYDPNTDFSQPGLPEGMNIDNYFEYVDYNKPYYDFENSSNTGVYGIRYAQDYDGLGVPMYTSIGADPDYSTTGTFSLAELHLNLYNISHGSYATAYPKEYWRAMGGPYFPVQVFDSEHGGYPDHRYVYHPNYSPLGNLLSQIGSILTDSSAMDNLLGSLTIGGQITINVFSMDITLDTTSPLVTSLVSSLTQSTFDMISEEYQKVVNPWYNRQDPIYANVDQISRTWGYDDPSIPRLANAPLTSEFYTDLSIDMESIIDDYPYIGMETRNDHTFAPGTYGVAGDGQIHYMNDSRDMGSNIDPWIFDEETGVRVVNPSYKPGLVENGGDNREHFVKDQYYEWFKAVTQNWANYRGVMNPFFESENLSTWEFGTAANGYQATYDLIEDQSNWPIRWITSLDLQNPSITGHRIPTMGAIYMNGIVPGFELGVLSAYGSAWNEDPTPTDECGALMPIGYVWINQTTFPQVRNGRDDNFWENELNYHPDGNGQTYENSSWAMINIRLFDSLATKQFIFGLADLFDMNLHFYLSINLNASLFGYEVYGLSLNELSLGGTSIYADRCAAEASQSGVSGSLWGLPGVDGNVNPPVVTETPNWLPDGIMPDYDSSTYSIDVDRALGSLLDGLTEDILGLLLNNVHLDTGGITLSLPLGVETPLALPAWLTFLEGSFLYNFDQKYYRDIYYENWDALIDLEDMGNIWTEVNRYYDQPSQPYDISGDMLGWWPDGSEFAGEPEVQFSELIQLPTLNIRIEFNDLLDIIGELLDIDVLGLLWALINGDDWSSYFKDYLWVTLAKDRNQLGLLTDGNPYTVPTGGLVHALIPPAFNYDYSIEIALSDVTFNLMQMIKGGDMVDGYYHDDPFHTTGDRNYYYAGDFDTSQVIALRAADAGKGEYEIGRNYYSKEFWNWLKDQPKDVHLLYGYRRLDWDILAYADA